MDSSPGLPETKKNPSLNRTGTVAAGSKVTVGNAYNGHSVTAERGAVYNPRTGQGTSVSGVRTDHGGVMTVGDHTIAAKDGNVWSTQTAFPEQHR